jgi:hypothetical protein
VRVVYETKAKPSRNGSTTTFDNGRFSLRKLGTGDSVLDSQRRAKKMTVSQKGRSDKKKPKYDT